jgi:uncharacterized membrane protein YtjA (UPF0391 family)
MTFLKWSAIFLIIALIAAGLGFSGLAEGAADIAKVLFFIFLAVCLLFLVVGIFMIRKIT